MRQRIIVAAMRQTLVVTAMIFATILMASFFSLVFVGLGGEHRVAAILESLPGGPTGALIFAMLFIFVLGFFLDFVEISVIPAAAPDPAADPDGARSDLAGGADRDQPADLVPHPALRLLAVLPARRGAEGGDHGG